jgi:hypothetical protein
MRTEIVPIDEYSLWGIEGIIKLNPTWRLITCGQTIFDSKHITNFAVFQTEDESSFIYSPKY